MNMKKYVVILTLPILLACKPEYQEPEFLGIDQIKLDLDKAQGSHVRLRGTARFNNPNKQKIRLKHVNVDILLKGAAIGNIDKEMDLPVPPEAEFEVPLEASFNLSKLELLAGAMMLAGGQSMDIQYQGTVKISYYGLPQTIKVNYKAKAKL